MMFPAAMAIDQQRQRKSHPRNLELEGEQLVPWQLIIHGAGVYL